MILLLMAPTITRVAKLGVLSCTCIQLWVQYSKYQVYARSLTGYEHADVRKVMTMGAQQKWMGMVVILATLLLGSAGPGYAWRGGWHGGGWWGGPRVRIGIGIGPFWGPYWGPYWGSYAYPYGYPYGYPPVVAVPSTQVYVQPSAPAPAQPAPSASWYYCDNPRGYYPYVQQCPGGWRAVAPTPP
jgi:hypothetical protein